MRTSAFPPSLTLDGTRWKCPESNAEGEDSSSEDYKVDSFALTKHFSTTADVKRLYI